MLYYQVNKELKSLDNSQACFLPNNIELGSFLLHDGVFMFDNESIDYIRNEIGYSMRNKNFIDIGTNYGAFILSLHDMFKHSYGFEPNKHVFNIACANMALHHLSDTTTLFNSGLSDTNEVLKYTYVDEFGGGNFFTKLNNDEISSKLSHRLDGYMDDYRRYAYMDANKLDDYNLENIGLIKIDVEGFELNVLKGAKQTLINSHYPVLVIESWNPEDGDTDNIKEAKMQLQTELFDYLANLNYKINRIGYDNYLCYYNND